MSIESRKQLNVLMDAVSACHETTTKLLPYVKARCSPVPVLESCLAEHEAYECALEAHYERSSQCYATVSEQRVATRIADDCARLEDDPLNIQRLFDAAYQSKLGFLVEGREDLRTLRSQLERDLEWGTGATRQVAAYLALVTKTTADLAIGLAGFNAVNKGVQDVAVAAVKIDWLKAYKTGKRHYNVLTEEADKLMLTTVLSVAADLHPVIRAAEVTNALAKNVGSIMEVGTGTQTLREEMLRQLEHLEQEIGAFEARIKSAATGKVRAPLVLSAESLVEFCKGY
jgi:hypothetical protein